MVEKPPYSHKNSRTGKTQWLHVTQGNNGKLYYFSKNIVDSIPLPDGYEVLTSQYTGMPYLKKIRPNSE